MVFHVLHVILAFVCMDLWGFEGLGIAFFLSYAGYLAGMRVICGEVTGYAWTRRSRVLIVNSIVSVAVLLGLLQWASQLPGVAIGSILTVISAATCLGILQKLLGFKLANLKSLRDKTRQ
jgi:hypothetical protein